jgi:DnaJ-class molecular chaperone
MTTDEKWAFLWEYRDIETPCKKCNGTGIICYGSTSTFMGGIGGSAMTNGVCNHCWGSGDEHRHGADLKKLYTELATLRRKK